MALIIPLPRRSRHGKYGDEWCFIYVKHWHIGRWVIWSR